MWYNYYLRYMSTSKQAYTYFEIWDWDWDWSALYRECKITCTQKSVGENRNRQKKNMNLLSIVVATSRNMTWQVSREARFWLTSRQTAPIQGHCIQAITTLTDNEHNMFRWQQPLRVNSLWRFCAKGAWIEMFSTWNWAGLRVYRRSGKSHIHWTYAGTHKQQNQLCTCVFLV